MKKGFFAVCFAVLIIACMITPAIAAEDDTINEADIYLGDQAFAAHQPSVTSKREGTSTLKIENSPAVAFNSEVEVIRVYDEDEEPETLKEDTESIPNSPNTGIPGHALAIGTALMVLSCIPIIMRSKKK